MSGSFGGIGSVGTRLEGQTPSPLGVRFSSIRPGHRPVGGRSRSEELSPRWRCGPDRGRPPPKTQGDLRAARLRAVSRPTSVPQDSAHWGALWGTGGHQMYRLTRAFTESPRSTKCNGLHDAQGVGGSNPSRPTRGKCCQHGFPLRTLAAIPRILYVRGIRHAFKGNSRKTLQDIVGTELLRQGPNCTGSCFDCMLGGCAAVPCRRQIT